MSVDANPDPLTVTVTPLGPDTGLRVSEDVVPVNVADARSVLPAEPAAVTVFELPPLLNVKPFCEFTVKLQDPRPELAGDTVNVQSVVDVGPVTLTELSVDASPLTAAVTTIPVGPCAGLSVRVATVPVNVA